MTKRAWLLPIALFAAWALACKSGPQTQAAGDPQLVAPELAIAEQGLTDFRLRFTGELQSPQAGTLESATWELVVDEKVVKSGTQPLSAPFAPGAPATFQIEQSSRYVASPEELKAMSERGGSLLAALRGKLTLKVGEKKLELPYARSREVRVPRLPSVKLHELDAARYAADEASATFYLGVVNPNPFPITLGGLEYKLVIAGKQVADGTRGSGEKVGASATGVFEVQVAVNQETHGKDVTKLIKSKTLPYQAKGDLKGDLFAIPYELTGEIKLNESK